MKKKNLSLMRISGIILLLIFTIALLNSCTSSYLTTWKNPQYSGSAFNKIVVVGLMKELRMRKSLEYDFVKMLKDRGVNAIASLDFLSPDTKQTRDEIEGELAKYGVDGILMFELLGVDKEKRYVPTTYYYDYYYGWWGVQSGGYYTSTTDVKYQISLYANSDDKLVWTGQSDTYNPANMADLVNSLGPKIIASLKKEGLIK